jgi:Cu2+-exporting ATPase
LEQAVDKDATAMTTPVLLTVANMKCGGCSAAVRRILLQQPGVAGAAVNLLTETAVVQLPASATDVNAIAQRAAEALSGKGFPAELRAADEDSLQATAALMRQRKEQEMQQTWVMQIYIPGWLS